MMREGFIAQIDGAIEAAGFGDRSSFVRAAVFEKLQSMGFAPSPGIQAAPSRAGKGGRATHIVQHASNVTGPVNQVGMLGKSASGSAGATRAKRSARRAGKKS